MPTARTSPSEPDSQRALRLTLALPLQYRVDGERRWHEAWTENISRTGILFRTNETVEIDARVEMRFVLATLPDPPAVVCRGRIVRTYAAGRDAKMRGVAATIGRYRLRARRHAG